MDSIKNQLNKELQSISFSEERKQEVIHSVKQTRKKKVDWYVWTYRAILSAAIVLAISLVMVNKKGTAPKMTQAAGGRNVSWNDLLGNDSVKILLIALTFVLFYSVLKWQIRKRAQRFPQCANCKHTWSRSASLFVSFKNQQKTCTYCGVQNYQTRKSRKKTSLFPLLVPFMIVIANVMEYSLLGIVVYLSCVTILAILLIPYYVTLQLKDPSKEPLW